MDRLSKLPLPAIAPSQTRSTKEITYFGEPIDKSFTIRLCLDCRKTIFELKPETILREHRERTASCRDLLKIFPYVQEVPEIAALAEYDKCYYVYFLKSARALHGGDVGIEAARHSTEAVENMTNDRLEKYMWY